MAKIRNKKHQEFINQYFLCNLNQTEAYLRTYPKSSYDSARAHAARLVAIGSISEEIDRRLQEKLMSADEVLIRLANMGRSNIADFAGVQTGKDLAKMGDAAGVVKKFKRKVYNPEEGQPYEEIEIELYPADVNLERIGKHHGLFREIQEHTGSAEMLDWLKSLQGLKQDDASNSTSGPPGDPPTLAEPEPEG